MIKIDFEQDVVSTIKNITSFWFVNIAGTTYDQNITQQQINDIYMFLSDKEFLEKYYPEKFAKYDEEEFNEYGSLDEPISWGITYVVEFIDGSILNIDFWEDNPDPNYDENPATDEGKQYIENFEKSNWDTDKLDEIIFE